MSTQMSFFASVQSFAKPFVKAAAAKQDPTTVARTRFTAAADEAVKEIVAGADKGFWFKKLGNGYTVHLKNGAKVLPDCSFAVGNKEDALKLLEAAKASCAKGEFDEQFKATARAPRATAQAEAPATPAAAPAAVTPTAPAAPQLPAKSKRK